MNEAMGLMAILYPILAVVWFVCPLMIWSHLREQTKLLKKIEENTKTK